MQNKAVEVCKLLNQFIGDLDATAFFLELLESRNVFPNLKDETRLSLRRMCLSYLIITLSKWAEIYKNYKGVMPKSELECLKTLYKDIQKRGIIEFRNHIIGHIWNKKYKRPLSTKEVEAALKKIFSGNMGSFIKWISNPRNNTYPNTVVSICKQTRGQIFKEYRIKEHEII